MFSIGSAFFVIDVTDGKESVMVLGIHFDGSADDFESVFALE